MRVNQSKHVGVARGDPSLLAGVLVCGRCGYRMATNYRNNGRSLRSACTRLMVNRGEEACQSFAGEALDAAVAGLVLAADGPARSTWPCSSALDVEIERARERRQWDLRLEQARHEVERAQRQRDEVEPERLVARALERRWEEALRAETRLGEEHARFLARRPARLTASERAATLRLAADVPAIRTAPSTSAAERKEIVRLMLDRVVATVEGETERMTVERHWAGGRRTRHRLRRSVRRVSPAGPPRRDDRARRDAVLRRAAPAGHRPDAGGRGLACPARRARHRERGALLAAPAGWLPDGRHRPSAVIERAEGELTVAELSARLGVPEGTICRWLHKGLVPARKTTALNRDLWLVRLEDALAHDRQRRPRRPTTIAPVT